MRRRSPQLIASGPAGDRVPSWPPSRSCGQATASRGQPSRPTSWARSNVLEALRGLDGVRVAVMVTTDKVYRNHEWRWPYREDDALGGHDPYSASKAASEIVIASYRDAFLRRARRRGGQRPRRQRHRRRRLVGRSPDSRRRPRLAGRPASGGPPSAGRSSLAARAGAARRLPDPGAQACGATGAGGRLQFRPGKQRGRHRPRAGRAGAHRLRQWRACATARARKARTKPAGSRWKRQGAQTLGVGRDGRLAQALERTIAWYRAQHAGADARDTAARADIAAYETSAAEPAHDPDLTLAGLEARRAPAPGRSRGFLSRLFCAEELAQRRLEQPIAQINHTLTARCGTVRGMHFQRPPHAEMKLVSCLRGEVWDVAVDLRAGSTDFPALARRAAVRRQRAQLLIPEGFAHGFQALSRRRRTAVLPFRRL